MEPWILAVGTCLLGLLATIFGHDSTPTLRSHEEEAADFGMTWDARESR